MPIIFVIMCVWERVYRCVLCFYFRLYTSWFLYPPTAGLLPAVLPSSKPVAAATRDSGARQSLFITLLHNFILPFFSQFALLSFQYPSIHPFYFIFITTDTLKEIPFETSISKKPRKSLVDQDGRQGPCTCTYCTCRYIRLLCDP